MKMAEKEKFYSLGRSQTAQHKRNAQLKIWENSETNKQPEFILPSRLNPKVKFGDSVVFLAAAQSGDVEEVERLILEEGADVNSQNKDGLTSLHQCCIDDDFDMVQVLVKHGANVDAQDNEGWTPLHAAASCGHDHIVRFLLDSGAFPALVNNEGDTPVDVAEDYEEIQDMITAKVSEQGINVDDVRSVEEAIMLEDANRLKNDSSLTPIISPGGATPLHVAAAKNYLNVVRVLLCLKSSQVMVDAIDEDGWTPLHAAVYWGNMEAAEELVVSGADPTKKTNAGDTIEDLCEPELINELESLRKLDEEHNHRHRRNAVSKNQRTNRPSLSHSNSREDMYNKHPSPQIVRRRSSKERSLLPHLDIAKEREEREKLIQESTELVTTNSLTRDMKITPDKPTREIEVPAAESVPSPVNQNLGAVSSSEAREMAQEDDNSSKEAQNSAKEEATATSQAEPEQPPQTAVAKNLGSSTAAQGSPPEISPAQSPQESPKIGGKKISPTVSPKSSPKSSPKVAKKKPGMSPRMLQRVNLWEAQKTTPKTNSGPHPLASSTPTNGDSVVKRYPFQPKTIPQEPSQGASTSSMPPRSMSFDLQRPSSAKNSLGLLEKKREDLRQKRGSYDEARLKKHLDLPETNSNGDYKASSLPRGAKIVGTNKSTSNPPAEGENVDYHTKNATIKTEAQNSTDTTISGAKASGGVSSEGHPTPNSITEDSNESMQVGGAGRDVSREMSVESTTSNRSGVEESETGRKTRARRTRQNRKATQPVPIDVLDKINKHDQQELARLETMDSKPTNSTKENSSSEEVTSSESSANSTPGQTRKTEDAKDIILKKLSMSVFKPSPRPVPKSDRSNSNPAQSSVPWNKRNNGTKESPPEQQQESTPDSKAQASTTSDNPTISITEDQSPSPRPRMKSAARRKPKERRKATGITVEVDENEEVPDELSMFVVRKSSSADTSATSDVSGHSSYSEDSIPDSHLDEELKQVRNSLDTEQEKSKRLEEEVELLKKELEETKTKVLELNRKYEDAMRAYDQEKKDKEQKQAKISELESGSKNSQDLKHENQRLKDENSALIRVIGKLSRAPLHT